MDSKRLYKKLTTIFWVFLSTCPLWISLLMGIFSYNTDIPNVTNNNVIDRFKDIFYSLFGYGTDFENCLFPFILNPIENIFDTLNMPQCELIYPFAWFIQVYILELLIDIFIWLPKFIHNLIEKWGFTE